jgi:hypothetical protein
MSQWSLDDNTENTTVLGNDLNGVLVGGNTADVHATVDGHSAFHLDGSSQYVQIELAPKMRSDEIAHLWTKYAGNPVLSDAPNSIMFGQLAKNPAGGWFFFASYLQDVCRWESTDLVTWSNRIEVLSAVPGGWDEELQVALAFQKPDDSWVMFYRGSGAGGLHIGKATSADGTTFTRIDNGGVDDGLLDQFDANYDPTGIILVGSTYYFYTNGDPDHGHTNVYTSTDLVTFTPYANNPIFNNAFCGYVWKYGSSYYYIVPRDIDYLGSDLYDHGLALYRCANPYFDPAEREFLGYAVINDQAYDDRYLDTPTIPMTDIYRDTYAPEFGSTFYVMYSADLAVITQSLASTTLAAIAALPAIPESSSETYENKNTSYSFWMQLDTLTEQDPIFSVGCDPVDSLPVRLAIIKAAATQVISVYLGGGYRNTSLDLSVDTPYHVVVAVDANEQTTVYINKVLVGTFTQISYFAHAVYLFIGIGYGGRLLDGYVWDFRKYPKGLSAIEVERLYEYGLIG